MNIRAAEQRGGFLISSRAKDQGAHMGPADSDAFGRARIVLERETVEPISYR